jgi:glyoxylase-like metal-dependent hydrolase (beta-lactamase superfamily II)
MDPGYDCENQDISNWDPMNSPTTAFLMKLIKRSGKPLRTVFLSHHHRDHGYNLEYLIDLRKRYPESFPFTLICHENIIIDYSDIIKIEHDTKLKVAGRDIWALVTPGHTEKCDDISFWYPGEALIFVGDLVQPQGKIYEECTFSTPVSNHRISKLVMDSLKKIGNIPFKYLLMGHDGEVLNSIDGINSIKLTLFVLEREYELARYVTSEFPGESIDEYCDFIYATICQERGLPSEHINWRKTNGHGGPCEANSPESFYQLYDVVSIKEIVLGVLNGG